MNPNPTIDNELQKAIDDITQNTNSDPVFGDPVAAPEPVAPAPSRPAPRPVTAPRPTVRATMPSFNRPAGSAPMPDLGRPVAPRPTAAMPPKPPVFRAPAAPVAPAPIAPAPAPEPIAMPEPISEPIHAESIPSDMRGVKEAALRDLAPLVKNLDITPSEKFGLYRDIHDELHDNSVIADAYDSARDIADESERGEALLYLIKSIDNM